MSAGHELVADRATKAPFPPKEGVGSRAVGFIQSEGVILRALGDTLAICPPLIITEAEIDELFDKIGRGLDRTLAAVRSGRK